MERWRIGGYDGSCRPPSSDMATIRGAGEREGESAQKIQSMSTVSTDSCVTPQPLPMSLDGV